MDFVCRDNGFLSLHEWITRDKSNAPVRQSEYRRRVMLGWLNKLLLDFLAGNPSNQVLLFSKLEFFVHHIGQVGVHMLVTCEFFAHVLKMIFGVDSIL